MTTSSLVVPGREPAWIAAVAVLAVSAIVGALAPDLRWLHYASKPAATLAVAAMVLQASWASGRYRNAILAGLLLSTLGDVFLMLPQREGGPDWFVFGLASFLLAHVAYLVALCGRARFFARAWPFVAYAAVALADRNRARDEPDAVLARAGAREGLRPALARGLGRRDARRVVLAHEREILGQDHELRPRLPRRGDQTAGLAQVGSDVRAARHLHRGRAEPVLVSHPRAPAACPRAGRRNARRAPARRVRSARPPARPRSP